MSIHVIDTYPAISDCFAGSIFRKGLWDRYIDSCLPYARQMIQEDSAAYDFDARVLPVLNQVAKRRDALDAAHEHFIRLITDAEDRIFKRFSLQTDIVVVFYLGLCNGAGWVTELNGAWHILLGAEKIIELNWHTEKDMKGLIYHELGHVIHFCRQSVMPVIASPREEALWQLYSEGLAMFCEQTLCGEESFYHQNSGGWLNWCAAHRTDLFREYVRVIDQGESHRKFFGDWCDYLGVSDIGYYLGCELVKKIKRTDARLDIFNLSMAQVEATLRECASEQNE